MNTPTQDALTQVHAATTQARRALDQLTNRLELLERLVAKVTATPRTLYSVDEAATAIGVSRSSINRRINDGTIDSSLIGRRRLIPVSEVERLAA